MMNPLRCEHIFSQHSTNKSIHRCSLCDYFILSKDLQAYRQDKKFMLLEVVSPKDYKACKENKKESGN